ncbi:hypothetical protein [Neptunicella sp. SCSIO 80796]|uniref:hypothetical protein n=1 Tax=Neptunicella plasticusilytica TaxID=3117012 RepID=UPI003A4E1504
MSWLKRYVGAVKSYLPSNLKEDIGNELYSSLQDEYDEQAEQLGRELTEEEIQQILLQRGHPMTVAASYQPGKTLVSEELFPVYLQVLKWVFVLIFIAQSIGTALHLFNHADPDYMRASIQLVGNLFNAGLQGFAWVTLGFYLVGETMSRKAFIKGWHPRQLPNITDTGKQISLFESAVELIFQLLFVGFINQFFGPYDSGEPPRLMFHISEQLLAFLPWINLVMLLSILYTLAKMLAPYWTRRKIVADWCIYAISLVLLAMMFQLDNPVEVYWAATDNTELLKTVFPTHWWQNFIVVLGFIFIIDIGLKVRKFRQLN